MATAVGIWMLAFGIVLMLVRLARIAGVVLYGRHLGRMARQGDERATGSRGRQDAR